MLNIYTKTDYIKNRIIIRDCEAVFPGLKLSDCKFTHDVLETIEHGKFVDGTTFEDRFGRRLFIDCLSSSSKMLLLLWHTDKYAVLVDEIGRNAIDFLLDCDNAVVFVENRTIEFNRDIPVCINDVTYSAIEDANEILSGGGGYAL